MIARKHTMLCFAIVFVVVSATQGKQRIYPLGINLTTQYLSCEPLPKNNLSCPSDIKVAAGSGATFKESMDSLYANLEGLKRFANESCIQAVKKFLCLGIPRCERERHYVDIPAAISACQAARRVCPMVIKDIMLDCQANKALFESESLNVTKHQCKNIKDTTGTCPDVKYKVSSVTMFQFLCLHDCSITRVKNVGCPTALWRVLVL